MRYIFGLLLILVIAAGVVGAIGAETASHNEFGQRISTRRASIGAPPSPSNPAAGLSNLAAEARMTAASCVDATPYMAYRFIEGVDPCLQPLSAADLAELQDPFAVNLLQEGVGQPQLWPSSVEQIVSLVSAITGFKQFQQNYMLGEGSQIAANVVSRDASRNLRYVITWGANGTPSVFLSAAPTGTHPGRPAPFLQVIGYDARKNVFNYYQYVSNDDVLTPGGATQTWVWAGDSTWARNALSAGHGCFLCHINGALNMKELVVPWNNWNSGGSISQLNIPEAVARDPLYAALVGADALQMNFEPSQSHYTQGVVASSIQNGTISNVPALLNRLINTTTVNFKSSSAKPVDSTDVTVPADFFIFHSELSSLITPPYTAPPSFTITRSMHDTFIKQHKFALQQISGHSLFVYQQPGTTYFAFFVPVPAFEDKTAIDELVDQGVIDANFAASVLLVDFPNPVFSVQRSALMKYATQIQTAQVLPNPNSVPAQFIALVTAAAQSQPPCNPSALANCTPEQQFLHFAGQSDWQQRARDQINPYLAAIGQRIGTADGAADYLTMSVSRQAQFSNAPGIKSLDEFSLLLPCSDLTFRVCKRMTVSGTTADDPLWRPACPARLCVARK